MIMTITMEVIVFDDNFCGDFGLSLRTSLDSILTERTLETIATT